MKWFNILSSRKGCHLACVQSPGVEPLLAPEERVKTAGPDANSCRQPAFAADVNRLRGCQLFWRRLMAQLKGIKNKYLIREKLDEILQ